MPEPTNVIIVGAKSATLGTGDYITFRNFTKGGVRTVQCTSAGEAVVTDPPSDWEEGDSIAVAVQGKYIYGRTYTVEKGGLNKNMGTLSADTGDSAINL